MDRIIYEVIVWAAAAAVVGLNIYFYSKKYLKGKRKGKKRGA
jgi:hypothetical protein